MTWHSRLIILNRPGENISLLSYSGDICNKHIHILGLVQLYPWNKVDRLWFVCLWFVYLSGYGVNVYVLMICMFMVCIFICLLFVCLFV